MGSSTPDDRFREARRVFRRQGGTLRMSDAIRLGISRKALYTMRDLGLLEPLSRGLFRLREMQPPGNPDLVAVATRAPEGVICLISALAFHELTTQVPHEIHLAVERGKKKPPRIDQPPVHVYKFSGPAFLEGIEVHQLDRVPVRIYSAEKTIADCFKYRHKIGMDVALEALRRWHERRGRNVEALLKFARACRVERVIRPYIEAMQ